jgi:hypothetical protein
MFRRFKKEEVPNKLIDEVEPNTLSWTSKDAEPAEDEADYDDEDAVEGEYSDDEGEEPDEQDAEERARKAGELQAELQRQAEEFGLAGSSPVAVYGPNGEAVADLLDSLADVDDKKAEAIADAYEAVPDAERKVAQSVVSRNYRGGELALELQAAEAAVAEWLNSLRLAGEESNLYSIVAAAATDAVDALVLEDELEDLDFDTLYGPWSQVMDTDEEEAEGEAKKGDEEAEEEDEEEGPLGPNTEVVLAFLTRLAEIDAAQIGELVNAWRVQPKEELRVAHRNLQALADEDAKWREQLRLAQEEVFAWIEGRQGEQRDYSFGPHGTATAIREPAGPAVADAVAALVMADILEPEDAETLYAPWARIIKEPELPQFADEPEDEGEEDEDDGKGGRR